MIEHLLTYGLGTLWCAILGLTIYLSPRTRYNPITLLCFVWSASYFLTLLWGYGYKIYLTPNVLLLLFISCAALSVLPLSRLGLTQRTLDSQFSILYLPLIVKVSLAITLAATLYQWKASGFSVGSLASGGTEAVATYTRMRYQGHVSTVGVMSIAMAICNAISLLVGASIGASILPSKQRIPCVVMVCCSLLPMAFVSTSRLQLFGMVFNLMAGWLAGFVFKTGGQIRALQLERRIARTVLIAALALTVTTVSFQMIRSQAKASQLPRILAHLRPWVSGYIPGFGIWYHRIGGIQSYGSVRSSHLLAGVAGLAGVGGQPEGRRHVVTLDSRYRSTTNALTLFRDVLPDTGVLGACLFMAVLSILSTLVFNTVARGNGMLVIPLACCYTFMLWSVNKYQLGYGSQILGWGLACGYGWICNQSFLLGPNRLKKGSDSHSVSISN